MNIIGFARLYVTIGLALELLMDCFMVALWKFRDDKESLEIVKANVNIRRIIYIAVFWPLQVCITIAGAVEHYFH